MRVKISLDEMMKLSNPQEILLLRATIAKLEAGNLAVLNPEALSKELGLPPAQLTQAIFGLCQRGVLSEDLKSGRGHTYHVSPILAWLGTSAAHKVALETYQTNQYRTESLKNANTTTAPNGGQQRTSSCSLSDLERRRESKPVWKHYHVQRVRRGRAHHLD